MFYFTAHVLIIYLIISNQAVNKHHFLCAQTSKSNLVYIEFRNITNLPQGALQHVTSSVIRSSNGFQMSGSWSLLEN